MIKHINFLWFNYSKVESVSILTFFNKIIYAKTGNIYLFFGYFILDLFNKKISINNNLV